MPFTPLRLLIAYDDSGGLCSRVVPRMRTLLENRAFQVELHEIGDPPDAVRLRDFDGLILGTPAFGVARNGVGPSARVKAWVEAQGDLDEVRAAVFCVHQVRPGWTLRNTRQLLVDAGAEVVAAQAYWVMRPQAQEHILPAECMVRIR